MLTLNQCNVCPRNCGVDRISGAAGFCGAALFPKVARSALHFWEEPCISGTKGSGTVFFSGCNLRCIFCQNFTISHHEKGKTLHPDELASLFLSLQDQGAHNINLVTPTPHIIAIREALLLAKKKGLHIPIVYNTNGYESIDALQMLEGFIDIYLPDMKYITSKLANEYSEASNYFAYAGPAIQEMYRQAGDLETDGNGIAVKGLLIRHLILPSSIDESRRVLDWIAENFPNTIHVSLLGQYTPIFKACQHKKLNRKITQREYNRVVDYFLSIGLKNGYVQDLDAADTDYIPDFGFTGLTSI